MGERLLDQCRRRVPLNVVGAEHSRVHVGELHDRVP
jgi:hypothetical protein